jgi:DNA-binding response OmpR family regulator
MIAQDTTLHPATILVLDDEPAICSWIARVLERAGFKVLAAETGAAALAIVAEQDVPISLFVVDVKLPDMSGREFVHHAAARCVLRPVLYISGVPRENGADAVHTSATFLAKPFEPAELTDRVHQLLGHDSREHSA